MSDDNETIQIDLSILDAGSKIEIAMTMWKWYHPVLMLLHDVLSV